MGQRLSKMRLKQIRRQHEDLLKTVTQKTTRFPTNAKAQKGKKVVAQEKNHTDISKRIQDEFDDFECNTCAYKKDVENLGAIPQNAECKAPRRKYGFCITSTSTHQQIIKKLKDARQVEQLEIYNLL